ncbi:MAG: helix-turn-helix domain-containing protein [Clostridia bacterium]|nr:helix-turn-helix domain-containing protein [Clostridia bacterium]
MDNNLPKKPVMSRSRFPDGFRIMRGKHEYVTYIEHASLRIWYSDILWHFESHSHSAVEIIMPLKGEVIYTLPERVYRVQADEALIVPPEHAHDLVMEEGSSRYLLLFEPDSIFGMRDMQLINGLLKSPIYVTGQPAFQEKVRQLLTQTVECYERKDPLWNSLCYSYLLQMYVLIGQHYAQQGFQHDAGQRRMDPEIVDSARLYIDQNFTRDISLSDVSAFTGFSKYYFSRIFKQQLGTSFSEYLRQKRLSMAEDQLIHSRTPIQEIAVNAGFGSIATFNRVFREARNCSPSKYREIYGDYI